VFETIVKVEQNIENMKFQLSKRPLFNIQEAFTLLNVEGYHKVTQEDLQRILKLHGIITFQKEAKVLFNRFDKDKDGVITMDDFKHEIEPIKK